MLTFLAIAGIVSAQNTLTVTDFTLPQNGGSIVVNLTLGEENVYTSYGFKVETPIGVAYVVDTNDDVTCVLGTGHTVSHSATAHWDGTNKILTVGVVSSGSTLLSGQSLSLEIPVAATEAIVGTDFEFTITDITLIRQNGLKDYLDNVTFTATVGEPEDFITIDENSPIAPANTDANGRVKVKRAIKANEWSTICLPFPMTVAKLQAVFGSDYALADMTDYEVTKDGDNITKLEVTFTNRTGALLKNHPYIIKVSNDINEFFVEDVKIESSTTPKTNKMVEDDMTGDEYEKWAFVGSYLTNTTIPATSLFLSGNNFYYSTGSTKMKAFRAYFQFHDVLSSYTNSATSRIDMFFKDANGETTKIGGVDFLTSDNDKVYNLSGQQVKKPAKGIYVKDGKKVIIK